MNRDPFGFSRLYHAGTHHAASLRAMFAAQPDLPRTLDASFVAAHLDGGLALERSPFAAIHAVPPGHELVASGAGFITRAVAPRVRLGDHDALLRAAVARIFSAAPRPIAVALSGGLDSAVVLALARELEVDVTAIVLAPQLDGYSELDLALATARAVGAAVQVVEVSAEAFVAAVPDVIDALETPLYNLHPTAKWLLARAARAAGFATVISGDGADQVFTRDASADYLPLAAAAFADVGVALHTPFLDDDVIAHVLALAPDPDKRPLRALGATLPVPQALVEGRKISRLAPSLDLGGLVTPARIRELARRLGRSIPEFAVRGAAPDTPEGLDDRARVRWTTLALLLERFEAWP